MGPPLCWSRGRLAGAGYATPPAGYASMGSRSAEPRKAIDVVNEADKDDASMGLRLLEPRKAQNDPAAKAEQYASMGPRSAERGRCPHVRRRIAE